MDPASGRTTISIFDNLDLSAASMPDPQLDPTPVHADAAQVINHMPEYGPRNAQGRARRRKSEVTLETCNGTSWSAIHDRLLYTQADVVLAQEHRLLEEDIADKSAQILGLGWKAIWAPAAATSDSGDKRSTSGGVAIFARKYLGLTHLEDNGTKLPPLVDARLVAGKFTAPGLGSIVLYSGYLMCGVGLNSFNKDVLDKLRTDAQRHGLPWVCAADWNMEPDIIGNSDIPDLLSAKLKATSEATCI